MLSFIEVIFVIIHFLLLVCVSSSAWRIFSIVYALGIFKLALTASIPIVIIVISVLASSSTAEVTHILIVVVVLLL